MKAFLIEKEGRDERYFRLSEQREQKYRNMIMYLLLMDITLEVGNQLANYEGMGVGGAFQAKGTA